MKKAVVIILILAAIALGVIVGLQFWNDNNRPQAKATPATNAMVGKSRPAFSLPDVEGNSHDISEWDGKVVMLNFWATWCPPCRREIPAFIELQDNYADQGLAIIGVAVDQPRAVVDFIDPMGVNYPILVGEAKGIQITRDYGNRLGVLPYTVFIDRQGRIVATHREELEYKQAEKIIKPLL